MLQLQPYLQRLPRDLSGGQRQRVAMGRAIVRKPAVFLFDEPLSNLDAKLRTEMRFEIKKLHQELKTTCIYVTHDQIEAMTLASRVLILNKGRVEQLASPIEIYQKPASTFVASFIGQYPMNFLEASLVPVDNENLMIKSKAGLDFPNVDKALLQRVITREGNKKPLLLGVRPEDWLLKPIGTPGSIPISIRFIDDMGADKLVHAQSICGSHFFSIRTDKALPMDSSLLAISCESAALHLFDKETGLNLGE
jgi:ABC-type sugar transport system ATPase subunit